MHPRWLGFSVGSPSIGKMNGGGGVLAPLASEGGGGGRGEEEVAGRVAHTSTVQPTTHPRTPRPVLSGHVSRQVRGASGRAPGVISISQAGI